MLLELLLELSAELVLELVLVWFEAGLGVVLSIKMLLVSKWGCLSVPRVEGVEGHCFSVCWA